MFIENMMGFRETVVFGSDYCASLIDTIFNIARAKFPFEDWRQKM